ncbi:MAG: hypothetical protein M1813_009159 [Trichoglossum hirsutum]|nr:MAG: hypothetical protein M1813_009159 [Trichoglossum hirsutum]
MKVLWRSLIFIAGGISAHASTVRADRDGKDNESRHSLFRRQLPSADDYTFNLAFPYCVANPDPSDQTCQFTSLNSTYYKCQSQQCTMTFIGACMQWGTAIDKRCMCSAMNYNMCLGSCDPDWHRTRYLQWLNSTCGSVNSWSGFPSDWSTQLVVGKGVRNVTLPSTDPVCLKKTNCNLSLSAVISRCQQNADIPAGKAPAWGSSGYGLIDQKCFCNRVGYSNTCRRESCSTEIERTQYFLWLNATCSNLTGWNDIPSNWTQQLALYTPSQHVFTNTSSSWPSCLKGTSECGANLTNAWNQYNSSRCTIGTDKTCNVIVGAVDRYRFCGGIQYDSPCKKTCKLAWQRAGHLNWLNSTCSTAPSWHGLPANWQSLLSLQYDDLFPWSWRVAAAPSPSGQNGTLTHHCPSAAAKLGAFAAVNAAMALLVPILGRRTVVYTITFGLFGKPNSAMWPLTAVISVALHLISNFLNALLVKRTEGFSNLSVGALTLIWCTRPRLAWLAVALLPYQAEEAMYFQVAASAVMAEMALQLIGSVYMGLTAHYGQISHFYKKGGLHGAPSERSAVVMYVGALLWLVVIIFAISACTWSALGVNEIIGTVGRRLADQVGTARKLRRVDKASSETRWQMQRAWDSIRGISGESNRLFSEWQRLDAEWSGVANALQGRGAKSAEQERGRVKGELQRAIQEQARIHLAMRSARTLGINPPVSAWQNTLLKISGRPTTGPSWHEACDSWGRARTHWKRLLTAWTKLQKAQERIQTPQKKADTLRDIRAGVIVGMLGTWTAQWLFWVGYVTLAADS